jgi:hypothetical protein
VVERVGFPTAASAFNLVVAAWFAFLLIWRRGGIQNL